MTMENKRQLLQRMIADRKARTARATYWSRRLADANRARAVREAVDIDRRRAITPANDNTAPPATAA